MANYLIIDNKTARGIVGIYTCIEDLLAALKVTITPKGKILVGDKGAILYHSYNIEEWTQREIKRDLARNYLKHIECLSGVEIYTIERVK